MRYDTKSLHRRCFSLTLRTDGVIAKYWLVNSIPIVRWKTNFPVCTHTHIWMKKKFFVNLSPWRWQEKHSLQILIYNLFTERRNQEEKFASQILPLRTRQSHPKQLLGFHIWIEWSAMKTRRVLGTDGARRLKRGSEKWNRKMWIEKPSYVVSI